MDTKLFDDYQQQLYAWQKKFFDTWVENLPKAKTSINFSDGVEQLLKTQEELVNNYLEVQQKTTQVFLEAQKQFWEDYFEMVRKVPAAV